MKKKFIKFFDLLESIAPPEAPADNLAMALVGSRDDTDADEPLNDEHGSLLKISNGSAQEGEESGSDGVRERGEACELAACERKRHELSVKTASIDQTIEKLYLEVRRGEYGDLVADEDHAIQARAPSGPSLPIASAVRSLLLLLFRN
jgi:hypothetical protein